jgi:acetyl esterase/lipase
MTTSRTGFSTVNESAGCTHAIVLPGGGYQVRATHEGQPIVSWLEHIGVSAEVCDYPLNARHPKPLESVRGAVRAARAAGHIRVGLVGFSAGGHLAGHTALTQGADRADRVDFVILGYPIVSMERNVYPTAGETLLGPDASLTLRAQTSLDKLVTAAAPPMFLWHTAEDTYVPVTETYRLVTALTQAGVPHTTHVFARGPHSLGLAAGAGDAEQWTTLAEQWLHRLPARTGQSAALIE